MIYSTQHNKNTNEDPKTSVVFENLMLLPDNVFWSVLMTAAANKEILPKHVGLLSEFQFWPKWNPSATNNSNYVEPDVFFRFNDIDVIVEAKYSDHIGQYREEWEREFQAYINEYEGDKKKVVLLAVGGNRTYGREPEIKVGKHKCPIVKYSWVSLLKAVLDLEKSEFLEIEDDYQSSMKRIIRNVEIGFQNLGIHKYHQKVELKGISNLFLLGKVFQAAIARDADSYTLSYYREDMNSSHYGYSFEVKPKDGRRKSVWLSIAIWINEQETISLGARNVENWAGKLCRQIEDGKGFSSQYADTPYLENNTYYFDAKDRFYDEFNKAEAFDAQDAVVAKFIDDVCQYYLK